METEVNRSTEVQNFSLTDETYRNLEKICETFYSENSNQDPDVLRGIKYLPTNLIRFGEIILDEGTNIAWNLGHFFFRKVKPEHSEKSPQPISQIDVSLQQLDQGMASSVKTVAKVTAFLTFANFYFAFVAATNFVGAGVEGISGLKHWIDKRKHPELKKPIKTQENPECSDIEIKNITVEKLKTSQTGNLTETGEKSPLKAAKFSPKDKKKSFTKLSPFRGSKKKNAMGDFEITRVEDKEEIKISSPAETKETVINVNFNNQKNEDNASENFKEAKNRLGFAFKACIAMTPFFFEPQVLGIPTMVTLALGVSFFNPSKVVEAFDSFENWFLPKHVIQISSKEAAKMAPSSIFKKMIFGSYSLPQMLHLTSKKTNISLQKE